MQLGQNHQKRCSTKKFYNNSYQTRLLIKILIFLSCLMSIQANTIFMTLASNNYNVGTLSNYTIQFNRTLTTSGIVQSLSNLQSNYLISLIFDSAYTINTNIGISPGSYVINTNTNTITISLSTNISTIYITNIINPYPSQIALKITLNFYNQSNNNIIIDTCQNTLTFRSLSLENNLVSYTLRPGNVSTSSNITIFLTPYVWSTTKMILRLTFSNYWRRNLLNVGSNLVLNSLSFCTPTCIISNVGSFFTVTFSSLILINNNLTIQISNILSPATLQAIDTITIAIIENSYNSIFQNGSLTIAASAPNNLQIINAITSSKIGQPISLSLSIVTQDLFSGSDTIIIELNTGVSMGSTIQIINILVSSFDYNVQQNYIITLNNFILVTSIPTKFTATINIPNITSQFTTKPLSGNIIKFYRNGFLYDQSSFAFSPLEQTISNITLTPSNNLANELSNLSMVVDLSVGVTVTDIMYVKLDSKIVILSCNVISCPQCTCTITFGDENVGVFHTSLKIMNFISTTIITNILIVLRIRNPISSNYIVYFATTDSENYTKQTGSKSFPTIFQAVIPSSVFSLISTSNIVYEITNFTILLNFTNYTLINGYLLIKFDQTIGWLPSSAGLCIVNGNNGGCLLTLQAGGIVANISISNLISQYIVNINQVRNPPSTKPYKFAFSLHNLNNSYYISTSTNYQATIPYTINPIVTSSNCINSQPNIITLAFPYLPFTVTDALVIDDSSAQTYKGQSLLRKIVYPITYTTNFTISINNFYSLQPTYYQLLVITNDFLYSIFQFSFTISNCQASNMPILTFSYSGLPEDPGTLRFVINQLQVASPIPPYNIINSLNYLTLKFPNQYALNISISANTNVQKIGARFFNISLGLSQPLSIIISDFINVFTDKSIQVNSYSFSLVGSTGQSYQISSNTNTIKYNISDVTTCGFPCKFCNQIDPKICNQCYSSSITQFYFLDNHAKTCVTPINCSSNTYPDTNRAQCIICPIECLTCTSSIFCLTCALNYFFLNNKCLTTCPETYYPINIQQICASCKSANNTANCNICKSINVCQTCLYPYILDPKTNICVVSCTNNQIIINNTCFTCNHLCLTCTITTLNCTSCITGYYLLSNQCLAACPLPYVPLPLSNLCTSCSSVCLTCADNPTKCTSCHYPLKLLNLACLNDCPNKYFANQLNNTLFQCVACPIQCSSCLSIDICTICESSYYLYNSKCLNNCPISTYGANTTINTSITLICLTCSSNCLICYSQYQCASCQSAYYLSTNNNISSCQSVCGLAKYLSGTFCLHCQTNCLNCINSEICYACFIPYSLQDNSCVLSCQTGFISVLNSLNLPSTANNLTYSCKPCSEIYVNCLNCANTSCTACKSGFVLNFDKNCVVTCPAGYLNVSHNCLPCSLQCKTCISQADNCGLCNTGFVFYQNLTNNIGLCVVNCPQSTFNSLNICLSCLSPCLNCQNTSRSCKSCISGFYEFTVNTNLQCVSQCPTNNYIYQNKCISCSNTCASCDSNGCKQCYPNYYTGKPLVINTINYYYCYTSCPNNLPYLIDKLCSQCNQYCNICNNVKCLQCSGGKVGYNQYCLSQCPPEMTAVSGICQPITSVKNQTIIPIIAISYNSAAPFPFTIFTIVLVCCIMISKIFHPNTKLSIAIFSLICLVTMVSNNFYLIRNIIISKNSLHAYFIVLIIGVSINYVNNILFIFISNYTLLKDPQFSIWKRGNVHFIKQKVDLSQPSNEKLEDHLNVEDNTYEEEFKGKFITYDCAWNIIVCAGLLTSQNLYTIVFSKLLDLSIFSAAVQDVKVFKSLNIIWFISVISNIICFISGIILVISTSSSKNEFIQQIFESIDLISLNFVAFLLGLFLLRKKPEVWLKQKSSYHNEQSNSTKKVIFQNQSHDINIDNEIQNQQEVNGRITNLFGQENVSRDLLVGGQLVDQLKSSTNQEVDDRLYFEKEAQQNLDEQKDIKLDNNIIWMQINPHDMAPQFIQKGNSQISQLNNQSGQHALGKTNQLNAQEAAQVITMTNIINQEDNNIDNNQSQQQSQSYLNQWQFAEQNGDQMVAYTPKTKKQFNNKNDEPKINSNQISDSPLMSSKQSNKLQYKSYSNINHSKINDEIKLKHQNKMPRRYNSLNLLKLNNHNLLKDNAITTKQNNKGDNENQAVQQNNKQKQRQKQLQLQNQNQIEKNDLQEEEMIRQEQKMLQEQMRQFHNEQIQNIDQKNVLQNQRQLQINKEDLEDFRKQNEQQMNNRKQVHQDEELSLKNQYQNQIYNQMHQSTHIPTQEHRNHSINNQYHQNHEVNVQKINSNLQKNRKNRGQISKISRYRFINNSNASNNGQIDEKIQQLSQMSDQNDNDAQQFRQKFVNNTIDYPKNHYRPNKKHQQPKDQLKKSMSSQQFKLQLQRQDHRSNDKSLLQFPSHYKHFQLKQQENTDKKMNTINNLYASSNISRINTRLDLQSKKKGKEHDNLKLIQTRQYNSGNKIKVKTIRNKSNINNSISANKISDKSIQRVNNISQPKVLWKSRLIGDKSYFNSNHKNVDDDLSGTTRTIQQKSRMAEVKAKLQSIYLPPK